MLGNTRAEADNLYIEQLDRHGPAGSAQVLDDQITTAGYS
jgi:hypothetical protein